MKLEERNGVMGAKVNPDKHLAAGTPVQINRPVSKFHMMVGKVVSHNGNTASVQNSDGETSEHPVSSLHHYKTAQTRTYENTEMLEGLMSFADFITDKPVPSKGKGFEKGNKVHLGLVRPGGAGYRGRFLKIEGDKAYIQSEEPGKYGYTIWSGAAKNLTLEEAKGNWYVQCTGPGADAEKIDGPFSTPEQASTFNKLHHKGTWSVVYGAWDPHSRNNFVVYDVFNEMSSDSYRELRTSGEVAIHAHGAKVKAGGREGEVTAHFVKNGKVTGYAVKHKGEEKSHEYPAISVEKA